MNCVENWSFRGWNEIISTACDWPVRCSQLLVIVKQHGDLDYTVRDQSQASD